MYALLKLSQYFFGFISVIFVSYVLGDKEFGAYTLAQSCLEFAVVLAGMGGGAYFSRISAEKNALPSFYSFLKVIAVGSPFSAVFVLTYYYLMMNEKSFELYVVAVTFFSSLLLSFVVSVGGGLKYFDNGFYINSESVFRLIGLLVVLILIYLNKKTAYFSDILVVNLFLYAASAFLSILLAKKIWSKNSVHVVNIDFRKLLNTLIYSCASFVSKKSDPIFVGIFFPLDYVGKFKLAFLICEVPFQFLNSFLNSKTKYIHDVNFLNRSNEFIFFFRKILPFSLASAAFLVFFILGESIKELDKYSEFWYLPIYFSIKCVSFYFESICLLRLNWNLVSSFSLISAIIKIIIIFIFANFFVGSFFGAFIFVAIFDFIIWFVGFLSLGKRVK